MSWFLRFLKSTVGAKIVMAISGLALLGFVVAHMIGNLQIFLGETVLNHYAAMLQGEQMLLLIARLGLLTMLVAHVGSSALLVMRTRAARPQGYRKFATRASSYASRTMIISGPIVLLFIIYHLLHFTIGFQNLGLSDSAIATTMEHCHRVQGELECSAYDNVVRGFSMPAISAFYIVAQLLLGMHLGHGAYSMFRTLGLSNPRFDRLARAGATAVAVLIVVGNCSIPLAVLTGLVGR